MILDGELVDGYHVESVPQFNRDDTFDMNALSDRAGMRAIWLLYHRGQWEHLEDIGVDRSRVEPKLKRFKHYGELLTPRQVAQVEKYVPEFVEASKELRLAYALKRLDEKTRRKQNADVHRRRK